jgi:oxygen-dependent protoporphyrinogen oxidase
VTAKRVVVVGAGIAGLAAAAAVRRDAPAVDLLVLEAAGRAGGLVETERTAAGLVLEHGADCLVTATAAGVAAVQAAGLAEAIIVRAGPRRSYLATREGLVPMPDILAGVTPSAILSVLRSPLVTFAGKARLGIEPLVPRRRQTDDESVRAFVTRRYGREVARTLVEPLIAGIHGGDPSRLSADACLPRLRALEREHGSLTLGVQRAIRRRRRSAHAGEPVLPPIVSLRDGMASLPQAIGRTLGARLTLGAAAGRIVHRGARHFRVDTSQGTLTCDGVIVATPAWQAPALLEALSPDVAAGLASIAHKALDCVTLAWPRGDVPHPLDGTGWVRAAGDARRTMACTWSSRKWPGRAPHGLVLMRSVLSLPDAEEHDLVGVACAELADLVGVATPPRLVRVRRLRRATPIYQLGHLDRMSRLAAQLADRGAIAMAGNAHAGIGVADCIASGEAAARAVLAAVG